MWTCRELSRWREQLGQQMECRRGLGTRAGGECRGEGAGRGSRLSEAEQCGGLGSSMEPIWWGAEAALGRPVM